MGERVRRYRRLRKLTQEALAELSGVDRSYLGKIETGEVLEPGAETVKKLATALKVRMRDLAEPLGWYGDEGLTPAGLRVLGGREFPNLRDSDVEVLLELAARLDEKAGNSS